MAQPHPVRTLPERPPEVGELVQVRSRRWLVEEVRVSVFAQELGTAIRVSRKKLDEQWSRVSAL